QGRSALPPQSSLDVIFRFGAAQLAIDDQLDGHRPSNALFRRGRDRFIIGVRMERIAVVIDRIQRLQRRPDVIEIDLLGMEAPPAGLYMIFQFLRPAVAFVDMLDRFGPDAPRYPADNAVFRVHAVAEEERQVGSKSS